MNIYTNIFSTVYENHRKSLIQHCERSELRKCQNTVLTDKSILKRQKLVENAKFQKFK